MYLLNELSAKVSYIKFQFLNLLIYLLTVRFLFLKKKRKKERQTFLFDAKYQLVLFYFCYAFLNLIRVFLLITRKVIVLLYYRVTQTKINSKKNINKTA